MDFFSRPFFEKWVNSPSPEVKAWLEFEEDYLRERVEPGGKVLDVGCGFGRHLRLLAPKSAQVFGVDKSAAMAEKARRNLVGFSNAKVFLGDAEKLDFEDGKFDSIICLSNTFGNLLDAKLCALREMARVCSGNGKIIVSVYAEKALGVRLGDYTRLGLRIARVEGGTVFTEEGLVSEQFSRETLEDLFSSAGLEGKISPIGKIAYFCELAKGTRRQAAKR